MDVTPDKKAAVTLRIDDDGLHAVEDGRAAARSGAQGLIGEKFVDCEPGSSVGARRSPRIDDGDGKGERLLPVEHTSSPVDLDLLNDILRLPYRQRLAILLNEFGTGLAGRGEELNEVIHRANPALRETDKVLTILAEPEPRRSRGSRRDSDQALAPLAREREHFADFIVQANATGRGVRRAPRRHPARASTLLPGLPAPAAAADGRPRGLRRPGHAAAHRPERGRAGTSGRLIKAQGTLADAVARRLPEPRRRARARPPRADRLAAADPGPRAGSAGRPAPVAVNLDELTQSLEKTGALQRLNDVLYYRRARHERLRLARATTCARGWSRTCARSYAPAHAARAAPRPSTTRAPRPARRRTSQPLQAAERGAGEPEPERRQRRAAPAPCCATCSGQADDPSADRQREQNLDALRKRSASGLAGARPARAGARLPAGE